MTSSGNDEGAMEADEYREKKKKKKKTSLQSSEELNIEEEEDDDDFLYLQSTNVILRSCISYIERD